MGIYLGDKEVTMAYLGDIDISKVKSFYLWENSLFFLDATNPLSYPGSGDTWLDLSGNGNNALLNNSLSASWDSAGYFQFTSSAANAIATITQNSSINTLGSTSDFSIVAIYNWQGEGLDSDADYIITKNNLSSNPGFGILASTTGGGDNKVLAYVNDDGVFPSEGQITSGTYPLNNWLVMTYVRSSSDDNLLIYLNKELRSTRNSSDLFNNSLDLLIGGRGAADFTFNGKISLVAGYNRTLSNAEINYFVDYYLSIL